MTQEFDAIVLGAGGMGSAAAYYLAASGQKVLLLEQFELYLARSQLALWPQES